MDRRVLFVETLNDLHHKVEPGQSEYNILKMSGLLRQLLLDSPRLIDQVQAEWQARQGRKIKIRFRIAIGGAYERVILADKPVFWSVNDGFYPPDALVSKVVRDVSVDDFLRVRIMIFEGYGYTVREVIRELAHIEGGVHAGTPRGTDEQIKKEQALARAGQAISIGGYPAVVSAVRAVGRVVYDALEPLKSMIEKELQS